MSVIREETGKLLHKGAIRKVSWEEASNVPGHYSNIFAVPKPGGNWRLVINLKPLNEFILKKTFNMETARDVRTLLKRNDFGAVVDLTDAYYTVKLHEDSHKH